MAQLVEHNLAKVGVAGSSPVVRSIACQEPILSNRLFSYPAKWPSGKAEACKAFTPGSNPGFASSEFKGSERAPFPCALQQEAARARTALAARAHRSPTCGQKSVESGISGHRNLEIDP